MKKIRIITVILLALTMCLGMLAACSRGKKDISAEPLHSKRDIEQQSSDDIAEPRGVYTKIKVYVDGCNGEVWVGAKNTFTLFSSIVHVSVELYASETYQDDLNNMSLVASAYTYDLNMNESIEANASTGGVKKYWKGKVRYRVDSREWEEIITETLLFNEQGIFVS